MTRLSVSEHWVEFVAPDFAAPATSSDWLVMVGQGSEFRERGNGGRCQNAIAG